MAEGFSELQSPEESGEGKESFDVLSFHVYGETRLLSQRSLSVPSVATVDKVKSDEELLQVNLS